MINNKGDKMSDIIIPKSTVKGLFLGIGITIIILSLLGLGAATFYVGTQNIDLQGAKIVNGATPSSDSDYATKGYVDSNAGLSSAWVSIGTTDCNGYKCVTNDQFTLHKLCIDNSYVYSTGDYDSTSGSTSTVYGWNGTSWVSLSDSNFWLTQIFCVG